MIAWEPAAENVVETRYGCDRCRDRGWYVEPDGGAGTAKRCPCQSVADQRYLKVKLGNAGLEADEIESAFSPWDESAQPKPLFAAEWLDWALTGAEGEPGEHLAALIAATGRPRSPWSLTLLGIPGTGKTKTAAVLARRYLIAGGQNLIWARIPEAFDRVQRERFADVGAALYEDRLTSAGLAVLDEQGFAHRANAELMADTVAEWILRRHRRHLPTVLTSNAASLAELLPSGRTGPATGIGRLASRLAAGVYKLMGGEAPRDYRDGGEP